MDRCVNVSMDKDDLTILDDILTSIATGETLLRTEKRWLINLAEHLEHLLEDED